MATRSLNKVMLIGNLTRDPELRYTSKGTAVCSFGIATNRYWTPSDGGETQEQTEFHRIVSWQKLAEICAQLLFKGRKVFVDGRLQTRTWTSRDGQERTTTEVVIDNMIVLDSRRRPDEEGGRSGMRAGMPARAVAPANAPVEVVKEESKKTETKKKVGRPSSAKAVEVKSRGVTRGSSTGATGRHVCCSATVPVPSFWRRKRNLAPVRIAAFSQAVYAPMGATKKCSMSMADRVRP